MLREEKWPKFEYLSNEFYQGSHHFQHALWALQGAWGGITHTDSGVQKQDFVVLSLYKGLLEEMWVMVFLFTIVSSVNLLET